MMRPRSLPAAMGAIITLLLIAAGFGNQWVVDAMYRDGGLDVDNIGDRIIRWLQFPLSWRVSRGDGFSVKTLVAADVPVLLLLVLTGLLVWAVARSTVPERGGFGVFTGTWWAAGVAALIARVVGVFLAAALYNYPSNEISPLVGNEMANGAAFGVLWGWLPALVAAACHAMFRRKPGFAVAPPQGFQPGYPQPSRQQGPYVPQQGGPPQGPPPGPPQQPGVPQQWAPPPPGPGPQPWSPPPGGGRQGTGAEDEGDRP